MKQFSYTCIDNIIIRCVIIKISQKKNLNIDINFREIVLKIKEEKIRGLQVIF